MYPYRLSFVFLMRLVAILLWAGWAVAGEVETEAVANSAEEEVLPALWFHVGEELHYRVYWGRIPVGTSVATTRWVKEEDTGRTLLQIRLRTQSNRVLDKLYPVDDTITALIEPHSFLPVQFEINLSEGRYRKHEITKFDHENKIAHWESKTRDRTDEFEIDTDTRDLITFTYYMRNQPFKVGTQKKYQVMSDDKLYDLWLKAEGSDRIRLRNYGRIRSFRLEPEAAFEGLFVRKGKMTLWVSTDKRRVLTQMEASIPVASIRLVLHQVRGPGNDDWILESDDWEPDDEEMDDDS